MKNLTNILQSLCLSEQSYRNTISMLNNIEDDCDVGTGNKRL